MTLGRMHKRATLTSLAAALLIAVIPLTARAEPLAVCQPGYAHVQRHVSRAERNRVYMRYGIPRGKRRGYVLDHFVPLELGGSNAELNLVPQARLAAHRKDLDENRLHVAVCDGRITLDAARAELAKLWASELSPGGVTGVRR